MAPAALAPLRHRNFALLWSAGFVSNAGTWMQQVAVGALVAKLTGSAGWVGLVGALAFLPLGLFAPVGGVLADRVDRRRFLIVANTCEAGMATLLAVLVASGRATPGLLAVLVFVQGCMTALRLPFIQAMLPDLVGRDDILAAASLNAAQYNMGRVVGPALAGVVIATLSYSWAFTINAFSYVAVITALALVRGLPPPVASGEGGMGGRIKAGVRAALEEPGCRAAIGLIAAAAFLVAPFIGLVPAKALEVAGRDDVGRATSALITAQGVGAVVGALSLAALAVRFGRRRVLVFDLVATPVALLLYAVTPGVITAVIALTAVGGLYIGILSGLQTVVQLRAPAEYRARILSLHTVALGAIYPLGLVLQGWLADLVDLRTVTIAGALGLLALVGWLAIARPHVLGALEDPHQEDPRPADAVAAM